MSRSIRAFGGSLLLLFGASLLAATIQPAGAPVPGEVLVKIRTGVSQNEVSGLEHLADADKSEHLTTVRSGTIVRMHSRSKNVDALITALQKNPNVEYVEPNYRVQLSATPNDPSYAQLWGLKNTGQTIDGVAGTAGADIAAEDAWGVTTGSSSIVIGVVDTGIDYNHPDLAANVWSNPGGKGNALCAAGTHGFNALNNSCDPKDDHYHGTHVSGTIGAVGNNATGVAGVNWTASIMGLKFLDWSGGGTTAGAISAIDFAVQAKIDGVNVRVLSNSWGGGGFSKALLDEINKAGENDILFVAAAGNDSANNDLYPHYPSSYAVPNLIAVAATDNRDQLAYFSNTGPTSVHLGAPGVDVYSTLPNSSYGLLSGTSMATPHVSGVAALVLAQHPSYTTAQVKAAILDNTDPIAALQGKCTTGGRLNAARALGIPPGPDFTLTVSPAARTVVRGSSATFGITVTPSNGFSSAVALSVSGLPSGATGTFNPPSTTGNATLTITTSTSTPTGTPSVIITATGGGKTRSAAATLSVITAPAFVPCPTLSYYTRADSGTPTALVTGDFNRDGKTDIASTHVSSNAVSVVLGYGTGGFQAAARYSVGTAPLAIAAGDFNGDGKLDLVAANSGSNNVSVLLGNGDGTFQAATGVAAGTSPFGVTTGDFNGDAKTDVAVANNGSGNVSILLGAGDGTFQAAVQYTAGSGAFSIAAADFNRDGAADLAVALFNSSKAAVLLGNGNGTFQSPVTYSAGSGTAFVAAGDVNRDGKPDLLTANFNSNNVSVLLGNGDGTLQAAANFAVHTAPYSVTAGDVDNDGIPDLVAANSESDDLSTLLGNGDGTFKTAIHSSTDYYYYGGPNQAVLGDFNGDGKTDAAAANQYSGVAILLNYGTCTAGNCNVFGSGVAYAAGTAPNAFASGDFNRDGVTDLAVVNGGAYTISIALGNADGTFTAGVLLGAGTAPESIAAGDFNGDGKTDLVVANSGSNNVSVMRGNGDGTFQSPVSYGAGTSPRSVAIGDFDRDGRADLAVSNSGSNNVSILRGNGDATFQAAVSYGAGTNPYGLAAGDFNRDGALDLATANFGSANVSLLAGNGNGTFQTSVEFGAGTNPHSIVAADFNRDGKPDLAVANRGSNNVSVLLGKGNAAFNAAVSYATGTNPIGLAATDFNLDGALDLVTANYNDQTAVVLLGSGYGDFAYSGFAASAGPGPDAIVPGDFNRDGKPDLAVGNAGGGTFSIILNSCPIPDLVLAKTHSGTFTEGATGATYTLTVTNSGGAPTSGTVTVHDSLPAGLLATGMAGSGWTCTLGSLTCTRGDALAAGASYPAITLTVDIASGAAATIVNNADVSGGGEVSVANDTATDTAAVQQITDLLVSSTHSGAFSQGTTGKTYTLVATNAGGLATSGTVTVTDILPAGLTATAMSGSGWSCSLGTLACTRSDSLGARTAYPPITLTVSVAATAPSSVINTVTVAGGGEANTLNDTATDPTVIWSGQTCGSFGAPKYFTVSGYGPNYVAADDFNGDGKMDLASTNGYASTVSVLIGNGDGTFQPAVQYLTGAYLSKIAVADLNKDGHPDLLVTITDPAYGIAVLLGNGDGTFGAPAKYPANGGNTVASITTGDFNGDGNPDVAIGASSIVVFLGTGTGTLSAGASYGSGGYWDQVVAAETNGDANVDLVASSYVNDKIAILFGNGNGTFQAPANLVSVADPSWLAAGDFNEDGKTDIAAPNYYNSNVKILLGVGDGTFAAPVSYATGNGANAVTVQDTNGDSRVDLVVTGSSGISILRGNGDGSFQPFWTIPIYATQAVVNDFDGDGKADLATGLSYYNEVAILLSGCPDLAITKTHSGTLNGGQLATYNISVRNTGTGYSSGVVSVADLLPASLSASSISSYGWNCSLATLTCSRSDSVAPGTGYDSIQLTVTVSPTAPASVTNTATVTSSSDSNTSNNSASDTASVQQIPDLVISKTHTGHFAQGQSGVYTIVVGNNGGGATTGTVIVTDYLPFGMTATSMTGTGWNCQITGTPACTRSDSLAYANTYPPITLTVSVSNGVSEYATNYATVSGGGDPGYGNVYDTTYILLKPGAVAAVALSNTQVKVTWTGVPYANGYEVLRSVNHGPYDVVGTTAFTLFVDPTASPNNVYLYEVRATDGSVTTGPSAPDIASTYLFTDDPIVPGTSRVRTLHVTELRSAVNALRVAAGLPAAAFTDPALADGSPIRVAHILELRTALEQARAALGYTALVFVDPSLTASTPMKAVHLQQLRSALK